MGHQVDADRLPEHDVNCKIALHTPEERAAAEAEAEALKAKKNQGFGGKKTEKKPGVLKSKTNKGGFGVSTPQLNPKGLHLRVRVSGF